MIRNTEIITKEWLEDVIEKSLLIHDSLPSVINHKIKTMFSHLPIKDTPDQEDNAFFNKRIIITQRDIYNMWLILELISRIPAKNTEEKRYKLNLIIIRLRNNKRSSWRNIAEALKVSHTKAKNDYEIAMEQLAGIVRKFFIET